MPNKPTIFAEEPKTSSFVKALETMLPVFSALAAVLAVRLFLLLAVIGAFILAQAALPDQSEHGLYVLIAYCSLVILPLVWLDTQKR